jgi:hypothetical protein
MLKRGESTGALSAMAALVPIILLGCISGGNGRGQPLYPKPAEPLSRAQVALLGGYVAEVDGKDVRELEPPYELLPGCHLVRTGTEWGAGDRVPGGSVWVTTSSIPFALPMRAGHSYNIRVETGVMTGPTGTPTIQAFEIDPGGKQTRVIEPAKGQADIDACVEFQRGLEGTSAAAGS